MTCQSCIHFLKQSDEQGLCRRYPPTLFLRADDSTISIFPPMLNEGWCGEFQVKEQSE